MTAYQKTIDRLFQLQFFGIKLGLNSTRRLLDRLGRPEKGQKFIHLAGTNGKGSVGAMIASILGRALASHKSQMQLFQSEDPALPRRVARAFRTVIEAIEADGSPELKRELGAVRQLLEVYEGLSLRGALRLASTLTRAEKGPLMTVIEPYPPAPASLEVDWEEIRRFLEAHE